MLINARPRIVSHGFETFVPSKRVESLHQRLVKMTNNDVNGWDYFRPVATPSESWDQNLDDFSNNESLPLHTLYSDYYQDIASVSHPRANTFPIPPPYPSGRQVQCNTQELASDSRSIHQEQARGLSCVEKRSPMLATGYSHWSIGQRHGSFAEFSDSRNNLKPFTYQNLNGSDLAPFISAVPLAPQSSYQEDVSMITDFSADMTSPSTAYSSYSSTGTTVDPVTLLSTSVSDHQNISMKNTWWPDNSRSDKSQYQDIYGVAMLHEGLPKPQIQQCQQHVLHNDLWNAGSSSSNEWATQMTVSVSAPITISPKALTLDIPPASFSPSVSSQGSMISLSDSSSVSSSREDTPDSGPETLSVIEPLPVRQQRQILPSFMPRPRIVPILPSNEFASKKTTQKRFLKPKSESHSHRRASPSYINKRLLTPTSSSKVKSVSTKAPPKRIEPKPTNGASWSDTSQTSATRQATHHRDAKDDFLIRSKLAGMSYKDIRRQGSFVEAESTLRGRFRTLTKHKAARVRKPEWTDNDIRLLKRSVRRLTAGSDSSKNKVPWKQVAEYIANNGGSYHFGNATCRKRWDELQANGKA